MCFAIIFSTKKFRREKRNVPESRETSRIPRNLSNPEKPPESRETSRIPGNLPNPGKRPKSRETSPNPWNVQKNYFSIIFSTICIAFDAAPFRILSATTQRFTPFSTLKSLLILPTKTSSCPFAFVARG